MKSVLFRRHQDFTEVKNIVWSEAERARTGPDAVREACAYTATQDPYQR